MSPVGAVEVWVFPPEPASGRAARRCLVEALERRGLGAAEGTASLVLSELATNAVLHARTTFEVRLVVDDDVVRIEVHDDAIRRPTLRHFSDQSISGRGLRLVDQLSVRWGVASDPPARGKTVWAEVATTGAGFADADVFDLAEDL